MNTPQEPEQAFTQKLASLINITSRENESNTPDFILAEMMHDCLRAFERASLRREDWYGRSLTPAGLRTYAAEECAPLSHSWELWTHDPRRWPWYFELKCTVCGVSQWTGKSNPPEGWTPEPELRRVQEPTS